MISTEELINWVKECHDNVSIHAFDSWYKKFVTYIAANTRTNIALVYIVKDHHCHPITNEKLKILASKANQGGCNDLLKHMSDLKWTRHHDNVTKIKSVCNFDKENHIVVLPEGVKIKDAVSLYSRNENLYVEYLLWNNNGILDGFIDHKKNMFLLNEQYDTRKTICDKLFNTFKTHDFKWTNQSYTSISTSLFKQLNGYIPESSYNVNTRQMLDEYYPKALQWCTTDDIPEDVISIDIAKCYPTILLNNLNEIPIYSIHDVIEPFDSKEDLKKCGEFYIDEAILDIYRNPINIEAGFYSSNLVSYLVDTLNIKYKHKIVAKRALKPDTFNEFNIYLTFNTFNEFIKAYVTDSKLVYFEKYYRENMSMSDYKIESGKGCIYNGQAGSGKKTKLCKMVQETDKPLVLSFTNKAIENVKSRLIKMGLDKEDVNKICHSILTFANGTMEIITILLEKQSSLRNLAWYQTHGWKTFITNI